MLCKTTFQIQLYSQLQQLLGFVTKFSTNSQEKLPCSKHGWKATIVKKQTLLVDCHSYTKLELFHGHTPIPSYLLCTIILKLESKHPLLIALLTIMVEATHTIDKVNLYCITNFYLGVCTPECNHQEGEDKCFAVEVSRSIPYTIPCRCHFRTQTQCS